MELNPGSMKNVLGGLRQWCGVIPLAQGETYHFTSMFMSWIFTYGSLRYFAGEALSVGLGLSSGGS